MKVGDLVIMPGSIYPSTGIILQTTPRIAGTQSANRVKVFWMEDNEASWEPKKWLEVISEGR
tara:strand:- start:2772 stop:2957 length:186 start_codon:yes stop_codon:yes gene_type:complete